MTSAAWGGDDNGDNDDHSVTVAALVEYPNLWHANPYGGGGEGSTPSLRSSPGQYAPLFGDLPAAGDGLYHGGGGGGDCLQDGHRTFAAAMNERYVARIIMLRNNQHKRKEVKWWRDSSPGGVSLTMVGVAATTQQST